MKTFIRWSGNKSKYLKQLSSHFPKEFHTYIEPFVGSGAVFLFLHPKIWIINDLNLDLINLWKLVEKNPSYILREIAHFQNSSKNLSLAEKTQFCKDITINIPKMKPGNKRSITFFMMKQLAYMGHIIINDKYRFSGFTNKPIHMFSDNFANNLNVVSTFIQGTSGKIYNLDYKVVLKEAKQNDFVFLDPPYIEPNNYHFSYNIDQKLDMKFLKQLKSEVSKLDKKGVKWMMTQADTFEVRDTFKDYHVDVFKVFRKASNTTKHELIIKNYT